MQKYNDLILPNIKGLDDERIKSTEEYTNDFVYSFNYIMKYRKKEIG